MPRELLERLVQPEQRVRKDSPAPPEHKVLRAQLGHKARRGLKVLRVLRSS